MRTNKHSSGRVEVKSLTRHLVNKYLKSNEEVLVEDLSSAPSEKEKCNKESEIWEKIVDKEIEENDWSLLEKIIFLFSQRVENSATSVGNVAVALESCDPKNLVATKCASNRIQPSGIMDRSCAARLTTPQKASPQSAKLTKTQTPSPQRKKGLTSPTYVDYTTKWKKYKTSSPWKDKIKGPLARPVSASVRREMKSLAVKSPLHSHSRESWIPEEIRQKMVERDLVVAMENLESKQICLNTNMNVMKRRSLNAFERSLSKEKYGIEQRKPCGLCCTRFLPVNLIMAVPLKAVLDIRDSWGDKYDPEGSIRVRINPNLRKAPACYNSARVCAFCSQLFDRQQETYRPSWEAKEAEKERIREMEEAAHWKVVNDPLSQMEKERLEEVNELTKKLINIERWDQIKYLIEES